MGVMVAAILLAPAAALAQSPWERAATYAMRANSLVSSFRRAGMFTLATLLLLPTVAFAQSPWERAANNLALTFTGPLARALALVAIVIGGLMFMYGEGGAKRQISGIVFGGGLALFAGQFLTWLF
jgi:type IV secretion system protein VirB2